MRKYIFLILSLICSGCAGNLNQQNEQVPQPEPQINANNNETAEQSGENIYHSENAKPAMENEGKAVNNINDASQDDASNAAEIPEPEPLEPVQVDPEEVKKLHVSADWFVPSASRRWYKQISKYANRTYLSEFFDLIGYKLPEHTYALIAPLKTRHGKVSMQYYSYLDTAFEYSMTEDGEENYWPASTVKLTAAVMALLKLSEFGANSQAIVSYTNPEGEYNDTVEKLCQDAIIPSSNEAYNRLMEIAGFDEINDNYLPKVFHFPKMVLQRRYVRKNPDDSLRHSPEIHFIQGETEGTIPERSSSGKIRESCPREANCTTLAELAEVMLRVVKHEELSEKRRFALELSEIDMLRDALKKAPSCIGDGVSIAMGRNAVVYNKGGKVIGDDRLEIAVVSSANKREQYLIALSMPYYEGVERETNRLAMRLIEAMQLRQ